MINHQKSSDNGENNVDWCRLTLDVNALGPPNYTAAEWKRKWIDHKYNIRRKKRKTAGESSNQIQSNI